MKQSGIPGLTEWGKNKEEGLRVAVEQAAFSAESLYKWLKAIKVEELLADYTTVPALSEWLSLYERHRHAEEISGLQLTVAFRRACNRAGLKDFRFHDLRHSFASYLTMGGVNLRTVQTLLGHKDLRMTMRYSQLSPEHLREAVSRLDKSLNSSNNVSRAALP